MEPSKDTSPGPGRLEPNQAFELVYEELKRRAHRQRAAWRGDLTLNTTAIVHEAYLKLADTHPGFENRQHFLCVAAKAMRQVLVDYSRLRLAEKRGGDRRRVSLTESRLADSGRITLTAERAAELIRLDEVLGRLRDAAERQADVVDCRFFAGLSIVETAEAIGISPATVKRDWANAQLWMYRHLRDASANPLIKARDERRGL